MHLVIHVYFRTATFKKCTLIYLCPLIIHFFYRPSCSKQFCFNTFENVVDNMDLLNVKMTIFGGFNINCTNSNVPRYNNSKWTEAINKYGFK